VSTSDEMHPGFIYVVNGKSWSEEI